MAENSTISWTDATWPIVAGCDYVSPGCSNCWAVRDSWRLAHNPHRSVSDAYFGTVDKQESGKLVWSGIVRTLPQRLGWPLRWRKPRKIFVCSQADLLHPKVPFEFIAAAFGVMAMAHWHTFQVLTKHAGRMREFFEWLDEQPGGPGATCSWHARQLVGGDVWRHELQAPPPWPLENVWLGVTVEDQKRAEQRIPELLKCLAVVRWLSVEPMLEAIKVPGFDAGSSWCPICQAIVADSLTDMHEMQHGINPMEAFDPTRHCAAVYDMLHWIVCGGESAQTRANTRPFDLEWARVLQAQCKAAGVPFFMKQLGTRPMDIGFDAATPTVEFDPALIGKSSRYKWHEPEHWPADLCIQEFPA